MELHQAKNGKRSRSSSANQSLPDIVDIAMKMTIDIVDFPIDSMVIFHSYVTVYQRVLYT